MSKRFVALAIAVLVCSLPVAANTETDEIDVLSNIRHSTSTSDNMIKEGLSRRYLRNGDSKDDDMKMSLATDEERVMTTFTNEMKRLMQIRDDNIAKLVANNSGVEQAAKLRRAMYRFQQLKLLNKKSIKKTKRVKKLKEVEKKLRSRKKPKAES